MAGWIWKSVLVGGSVVVAVLAYVATVPAATNLIANGTFEGTGSGSLTGWAASAGTLSLVAGNGGGHAARVTASSAGVKTYAYTSSKPVKSVTAGTSYTLDGTVSSGSGGSVCLVLREVPSGGTSTVGSAQQCVTPTAAWQSFPTVSFTAKTSGDSLTVNLSRMAPAAGASFDIDNVVLSTGTASGDGTPPSVPGGVSASAGSSTSATVTWSAANDNVGVTGYDVFRNGANVGTAGGSTTTFTDSTVSPSMTYGYTVDAFDAAGNHSAQSSPPASVTTPSAGGGGSGPCGTVAPSTAPYQHIVVLMDENLTVSAWQAATDAPFSHMLAQSCVNEANAAGETHPSFPNYLAIMSGTSNTCLACSSTADNIFHQLGAAGLSWRDYNQSMPKNCAPNTSSVPYYRDGHNPAYWFTDLGSGGDKSCAANDVPTDPNMWNDIAATGCRASPGSRPTTAVTCTG